MIGGGSCRSTRGLVRLGQLSSARRTTRRAPFVMPQAAPSNARHGRRPAQKSVHTPTSVAVTAGSAAHPSVVRWSAVRNTASRVALTRRCRPYEDLLDRTKSHSTQERGERSLPSPPQDDAMLQLVRALRTTVAVAVVVVGSLGWTTSDMRWYCFSNCGTCSDWCQIIGAYGSCSCTENCIPGIRCDCLL